MSDTLLDKIAKRNADETMEVLVTPEFVEFIYDETKERFPVEEERKAAIIGAFLALGFYGKELKRGFADE